MDAAALAAMAVTASGQVLPRRGRTATVVPAVASSTNPTPTTTVPAGAADSTSLYGTGVAWW
ncbi:hypothetical protein AB0K23_39125 [Streptomyces sp. NPDC049602]|uniref:hypothetical protein n=1 Tax=Streptomyces sp. NPDC049602 TaxID=3155504 RepID=UPI00341F8756